jgi:serine/threonine protein kinase
MALSPETSLFLSLQAALAGRYSLERELGRGGMGVVFLARDVRLDRPVALKLLPPERAEHQATRERFLSEARMAARLSHPNIVPIHAVEEIGGFVFFAMQYVAGETLGDRLRRGGKMPPWEAARILRDVSWALSHAHAQHVVHRDIKPDNILMDRDGRALVADFGIARLADAEQVPGRIQGTPEYLSPEQAGGQSCDARADLYSLGAVAFMRSPDSLPSSGTRRS